MAMPLQGPELLITYQMCFGSILTLMKKKKQSNCYFQHMWHHLVD